MCRTHACATYCDVCSPYMRCCIHATIRGAHNAVAPYATVVLRSWGSSMAYATPTVFCSECFKTLGHPPVGVTSVWRRSAIGETDSGTRGLGRGSLNKPAYTSCSSSFSPAKLLSLRVQIHMLVGQPCTARTGAPGATLDQLMTYDVLGTSVASEPVLKLHRPWKPSSERTSLLSPLPFEPPCERTSLLTPLPLEPPCERTFLLSLPFVPPLLPVSAQACSLPSH